MPEETIALVLAGGGARGAYEVGALSVLLPALGDRVSLVLGTSVGALNAAWIGANAHLEPDELVAQALAVWPTIGYHDVLRPLVSAGGALRIGRYVASAALGHARLEALLDPEPLEATVRRIIDFEQLHHNVADGRIRVAIAATSARTGQTVVFVAGGTVPGPDPGRGISYEQPQALGVDHVLASAAIPTAFPPVHVTDASDPGWYVDGGTRMNTPVKPALALGATRVVVIGLNGTQPDPADDDHRKPDALAGAAHIVQGLLADPLAGDIHTLAHMNELGEDPKPYIFVAPAHRDSIGELARAIYRDIDDTNLTLLGRLMGADESDMHGELFSYLCFAPEFAEALIERGRHDAQAWLDAEHDDGIWQLKRLNV